MIGGVTRQMLPNLTRVFHLHVNRSLDPVYTGMDKFSTDEFSPVQPVYTEPYPVTDCSAVYTSPWFWSGQKRYGPASIV